MVLVAVEKGAEILIILGILCFGEHFLGDRDGARGRCFGAEGDGDVAFRDEVDGGDLVASLLGVVESGVEGLELAGMFREAEGGDGSCAGDEVERPLVVAGDGIDEGNVVRKGGEVGFEQAGAVFVIGMGDDFSRCDRVFVVVFQYDRGEEGDAFELHGRAGVSVPFLIDEQAVSGVVVGVGNPCEGSACGDFESERSGEFAFDFCGLDGGDFEEFGFHGIDIEIEDISIEVDMQVLDECGFVEDFVSVEVDDLKAEVGVAVEGVFDGLADAVGDAEEDGESESDFGEGFEKTEEAEPCDAR